MSASSAILGSLLVMSLLASSCLAIDRWEDYATWAAEVQGGSDLGLLTSQSDDLIIDGSSISKNTATTLEASGTDGAHLISTSKLTTYDGDHVSSIQSEIDQEFTLPGELILRMYQNHEISGSSEDPLADLSSTIEIIDPTTGETLITLSSTKNDEDIDAIINQALAEMGFTLTIDDFRGLEGSTRYSVDLSDSQGGISCNWGETKNLPVDFK